MVIEQKERTENKVDYYYSVNELDKNIELAGIISLDLNIFDNLPETINDYTLLAMTLFLDKKLTIIRPSHEPMELPDCSDVYGISAASQIIMRYKKTGIISKTAYIISEEIMNALLQNDEYAQFFIDNEILSKEEIEDYKKENKIKSKLPNEN